MEETLGKRIACHRKGLCLTQDALAEQLGITAQAVSKWENDQSCPDISMVPKLAEIFAITTDELLGVAPREVPIPQIPPEEVAHQEPKETTADVQIRETFASPGAVFGFWLFLTGAVAVILRFRQSDCGLWDIAAACGVFAFGLSGFFRQFSLLRLGCALAGGAFVLNLLREPSIADIDWTIPLAAGLALLGLDLLIGKFRNPKGEKNGSLHGHLDIPSARNDCRYEKECFECVTIFGDSDRLIQLPRLVGGRAAVRFGNLTVDLHPCGEIADGCSIHLDCSFGSLEFLVPRGYRVEAVSSTAFGSVSTKGIPDSTADRTVFLNCNVSFGEITIRHI